ncbi:unnamed protein product [Calypogeia fissa]
MASPTVTIRFVLQVLFRALLLMLLVILSCRVVNALAVKESMVNATPGSFVTTTHMSGSTPPTIVEGCSPASPIGNQFDGFLCRDPCPNSAACTRLCSKGSAAIDLCSRCGLCLPNDAFRDAMFLILQGCRPTYPAKSMLKGTMSFVDRDLVISHT